MLKNIWIAFAILFFTLSAAAQNDSTNVVNEDSLISKQYLQYIEETLQEFHVELVADKETDSIIASYGYAEREVPEFSKEIYCDRLAQLNEKSPFHLDCNPVTISAIKYFAKNRRKFTSIILGKSKLYFPMFEEKLAKYNLPLELKYLSVIESALKPQVQSRVGATGLWQFMFRTGRAYGLKQTSYIDERMDPELATEAACKYLKKLHAMYNDWNMALAAYNAGPGNVNKAIRRSGGKMTYWEIRPFLPRETQGYVPKFIAMSYMMEYHAHHNVIARKATVYNFELDTVCLSSRVHMETIDSLTSWDIEDIKKLNPIYKTTYIPKTKKAQCISIPTDKITEWIALENEIYKQDSIRFKKPKYADIPNQSGYATNGNAKYYRIRKGDILGKIASRNGTTVARIRRLNPGLRPTRLKIGQRIRIR